MEDWVGKKAEAAAKQTSKRRSVQERKSTAGVSTRLHPNLDRHFQLSLPFDLSLPNLKMRPSAVSRSAMPGGK